MFSFHLNAIENLTLSFNFVHSFVRLGTAENFNRMDRAEILNLCEKNSRCVRAQLNIFATKCAC